MPEYTEYMLRKPNGTPMGPLSVDIIEGLVKQGEITPDYQYAAPGTEEWKSIRELPVLARASFAPDPYYITLPGGTPIGPLSLDALKVMARNGGLKPEHLYCTDGAQEWRPVTELVIIHSATPVVSPLPTARPVSPSEHVNSYIVPAVVLLALSFMIFVLSLIFAVVAVVYAAMAESAKSHDVRLCRRRASVAKVWCIVTGVTMGLQVFLLLVVLLITFMSSAGAL